MSGESKSVESANAPRQSRERKTVERLVVGEPVKERVVEVPEGKGLPLSEYTFFIEGFEKIKSDDDVCKNLHLLFYGSIGTKTERKRNIRKFSGWADDADAETKTEKLLEKKSWTVGLLKEGLALLGLERSGTREELAKRLVTYLLSPHAVKRAGGGSSHVSGKKRKSSGGKSASKKPKRAPSAFILFCRARGPQYRLEHEGSSFGDVGKAMGAEWRDLSAEDKEVWLEKARDAAKAFVQDAEPSNNIMDDELAELDELGMISEEDDMKDLNDLINEDDDA